MIKKIILSFGLLSALELYGQTPVDVAESTLKVGIMGEEVFYFGFAEGDQIIFNFEEANGKELKELEKSKGISQDQHKQALNQLQKFTDASIATIEQIGQDKEAELGQV